MEEEEKTMRKTIWEICTMIEMPQEVRKELELLKGQTVLQKVESERLVEKLADPDQWKTVWKKDLKCCFVCWKRQDIPMKNIRKKEFRKKFLPKL